MSEHDQDFPLMMERDFGLGEEFPMVAVGFGMHPMKDMKASEAAGHDVYTDVEHVKIAIPGDRFSLFFQPATDVYRKRFPKAYATYKQRDSKPTLHGMPIDMWAPISRSLALTLKAMNVPTVEALAEVHDGLIDKIGANGRDLRAKAQAFLAQARDGAAIIKEVSEKKALQDQIAALQAQITALGAAPVAKGAAPVMLPQAQAPDDIEADVVAAVRRPRARTG